MEINEKIFDIYITKFALSSGIIKKQAKLIDTSTGMVGIIDSRSEYYIKKEWSSTYEVAVKIANKMKIKKIAALKKQLKKIESLTFPLQHTSC